MKKILTFFAAIWCVSMLIMSVRAEEKSIEESKEVTSRLVLAHYMPWYTAKPFHDHWGWHWTMNHFEPERMVDGKREIASQYYPLIGPYDSEDPDVIEYHLLLMKLSGIDGVIVDWYGLTSFNDYPILHKNTLRLVDKVEELGMKLVICYEDQTLAALVKAGKLDESKKIDHVLSEIDWLSKNWFQSSSYVKLENKPVLLSFGNAGLTNEEWTSCLSQLKQPLAYFSEHHRRSGASGAFDWPVPSEGVERTSKFVEYSKDWPSAIPVIYPRFVDIYAEAKVGDGYVDISDDDSNTFLTTAKSAFDSKSPLIQIATWNDWGEGTNIEPSNEFGYRDLETLQQLRKKYLAPGFAIRPEDLRLPRQLLELRRSKIQSRGKLDTIASNLSQGNTVLAKRQIDFLINGNQ